MFLFFEEDFCLLFLDTWGLASSPGPQSSEFTLPTSHLPLLELAHDSRATAPQQGSVLWSLFTSTCSNNSLPLEVLLVSPSTLHFCGKVGLSYLVHFLLEVELFFLQL